MPVGFRRYIAADGPIRAPRRSGTARRLVSTQASIASTGSGAVQYMPPTSSEYRAYFDRYIALVRDEDVLRLLAHQDAAVREALADLPEERAAYRYAAGKWSVREVLGHMIDTERVFGFRALSIARGELASLPPFDENAYAGLAGHDRCAVAELAREFGLLRRSHVMLFRHMDEAAWGRIGSVDGHPTSTRAVAFMMAGHVRHHGRILSERYGVPFTG